MRLGNIQLRNQREIKRILIADVVNGMTDTETENFKVKLGENSLMKSPIRKTSNNQRSYLEPRSIN